MSSDPVEFALTTPGHLHFSANQTFAKQFDQAGGHVVRRSTGHLVFYRPDGSRFLAADPAGHPLHECEWEQSPQGQLRLQRARLYLDWGQWVGLKPGGLVNETTLNLAAKPGWERVTPDDLRAMAAQAMRVPIDEIRWFYRDEDLSIDAKGTATIRHRKDAFYVLENGGFDGARFMSCMGAMRWDHIDFLPVVELFKSLLPGTGSAAFELIRGLYDDQHPEGAVPTPLRYRGIPTYPSEAAFRLFSSFFAPQTSTGENPRMLFMDQAHASRVTWLPSADPPVRYVDRSQGICLTMSGGVVRKATCEQDSTGLPYVNPSGLRIVPYDRSLLVNGDQLTLRDRTDGFAFRMLPSCSTMIPSQAAATVSPVDWRIVFGQAMPSVRPADAFRAVVLYPEDDREIAELPAQPFVADYLEDLGEQDREISAIFARAERILIHNGDAVIATCIPFDRPREVTACYLHPAYAQKQAQQLWTQCAAIQQWEWLRRIHFVQDQPGRSALQSCDLVYQWVPYDVWESLARLMGLMGELHQVMRPGGNAFVVGPVQLRDAIIRQKFLLRWEETVENLPTFRMHRTILPKAQLKKGLTLFHVTAAERVIPPP